ncbi:MAG: redoxin [Burkholderiales bacterium RIFCSPLOWO2_12_FULL_61_40]|nr:MAG: redoxin [Burkholderiales bacterium RIFCSPLOWO2_12_FULL_61_40]
MTTSDRDLSSFPPIASASRRRALGVAAAAALAGVGVGWWAARDRGAAAPGEPVGGFWSLQWDTPEGRPLSMQSFKGRPLLLNFWATWCPPCVDELPLINAFYRQNQGNQWQVLGLAVDKLDSVQAFLKRTPLDFPIGLAGLSGADLGRSLGNLTGGLPFSLVIGSDGLVRQRKLGRLREEDLDVWARLK